MSEERITVGVDFGVSPGGAYREVKIITGLESGATHRLVFVVSCRGYGKSWLAAEWVRLLKERAQERAQAPIDDLVIVDELADIPQEAWARLQGAAEAEKRTLERSQGQARHPGITEALPRRLDARPQTQEQARRVREASRRHASLAAQRLRNQR